MRTDDRPGIDDRTGADNGSRTHTHARHDDGAVLEPDAVRQGCLGAYDTRRANMDAGGVDLVTLAGVAACLALVAFVAIGVPAARALGIDPADALRVAE